jgi:hypothetical protein
LHGISWGELDDVIVQSILITPETLFILADLVCHGICDKDEVLSECQRLYSQERLEPYLEEFRRNVLVHRVVFGELKGNIQPEES